KLGYAYSQVEKFKGKDPEKLKIWNDWEYKCEHIMPVKFHCKFDVKKGFIIIPILLNGQGVSPKEAEVNNFSFKHEKVYQKFL
ncbi:4337_t:CDS:2, partial [Gigaspora margarita]